MADFSPATPEPSVKPSPASLAALAQLNMGRVLRPLVNFATAVSVYFHARQFFFPEIVQRYDADLAYVTLLTVYAGHREVRRWSNDPEVITKRARRGEYFVVGWWTAYFVALFIANHALRYRVPEGLLSLCVQITTIFFGTLTSQQIYKGRRLGAPGAGLNARGGDPPENRILKRMERSETPLKRRDVEEELGVSRATAGRLLDRLEDKGLVEWAGENRTDQNGGFRLRKP